MENWLKPISEQSLIQADQMSRLKKAINRSLWLQRALIKRIKNMDDSKGSN